MSVMQMTVLLVKFLQNVKVHLLVKITSRNKTEIYDVHYVRDGEIIYFRYVFEK